MIDIWDASEYERSTDALEAAIKAAVQDALSETRNAGRAAFAVYSRARPDRVAAVLGSVDSSLAQKLKEGLQEGEAQQRVCTVACFLSALCTVEPFRARHCMYHTLAPMYP